jgi:hypothetical protein
MTTMSVQLRSIPDTQAAIGWAVGHTIVVDRPDGKAGGMGLGFNGGQSLSRNTDSDLRRANRSA